MSFYDDASLVVIPSGFKTSKVYAEKPTDGSGDLTFTRTGDTATRVNSAGLIEKVRTNLVLQSQTFDNASWGKTAVTVTANTTANPLNGALTADTITLGAGTAVKFIQQSVTAFNGLITHSVYLRAGTHQFIQLISGETTVRANFDLINGTSSSVNSTAQIVALANNWYRCSISYTATISPTFVYVWAVDSLASSRASSTASTGTFFIFGYQHETGDIATDYIVTTTAAVSVGPVANVPRLDYLGSTCGKLLLEPQRTNSVTSSENISTGWTFTNSSWAVNQTASPDGYANADSIIPNATSGQHAINSANITASGSFTLSAFVKAGEYTKVSIRESANTGSYASFNLATGTKIEDNVSGASFIQSYGNGWYRIGVTGTYSGTIRLGINVLSNAYTTGNPSSGTTFFSGNASDKLFCWGMQAELGATYATSYIPTLAASATRGADVSQKSSISGLFGATATTFVLDFVKNENAIGWTITGGNGTKLFSVCQFDAANSQRPRIVFDDGVDTSTTLTPLSVGRHKIAVSYSQNDTRIYIDGTLVLTDTSCTYYQMDRIGVNATAWTGFTNNTNSFYINEFLIIPAATSNAELAELTTL